ncbi:hypothetical protein SLEP1_g21591 [Rubroshorea leprosula]|uniref:Uncharacterized protein n=1 Tax=Rubroshorea leprosula TaxID=152421 RepID=A0AAV5JFL6_9ROSI|nr:hypothetical protein SLEP1_g21591 [Rubroshorea leprosula]
MESSGKHIHGTEPPVPHHGGKFSVTLAFSLLSTWWKPHQFGRI